MQFNSIKFFFSKNNSLFYEIQLSPVPICFSSTFTKMTCLYIGFISHINESDTYLLFVTHEIKGKRQPPLNRNGH